MRETPEKMPILELRYQGELVGWLDCASAFEPANEDQVWLNAAVLERFAA